jgi:ribonuclease HI
MWQWLKGHAGHILNEKADQVCSEVMREHGRNVA